jgi:hypothetical protein
MRDRWRRWRRRRPCRRRRCRRWRRRRRARGRGRRWWRGWRRRRSGGRWCGRRWRRRCAGRTRSGGRCTLRRLLLLLSGRALIRRGLSNDEPAVVGCCTGRQAALCEQQRRRDCRRCQQDNINSLHWKTSPIFTPMNSCVTAKWIGVKQSVARYLQCAIDGCNKAHGKSYFNRDLAKFTARSLMIALTLRRHFAWLLGLDRILWRYRKLARRSARRDSGRWRRWLRRRRLRHFFRHLCF